MRKYLLATVAALAISSSANADTFNVIGSNFLGESISGTIDADVAFTSISAVNLEVTGGIHSGTYNLFSYPAYDWLGQTILILTIYNLPVYLSYPGGPTPGDTYQEISTNYQTSTTYYQAYWNPLSCGTDLVCQAYVMASLNDAMSYANTFYDKSFSAVATASDPAPVPGPIVGAGLPGLMAMLGLFGFKFRRRKLAG